MNSPFTSKRARTHRAAAVVLVLALVLAACGSRRSDTELLEATRGVPGATEDNAETAANVDTDGSDALTDTTLAGAAGTTGGDAVGTSGGPTGEDAGGPAGGTTGGGTAEPAARQCTGKEPTLTIGSVGQQSGVFGPFLAPLIVGIQTWVKSVNAKGGINCHQIQFIAKDDGGDPSVHQSQVQELVEQRNVIALVGVDAPLTGNASVPYLTSKKVPVIGNEGGSDWTYDSPVYFPQLTTGNTALNALVGAVAQVGKPQGKSKLGVLTCLEAALCSALFGSAEPLAQRAGLNLVYKAQASLTQPDFTSVCQNAKNAGVEMFIAGLDTNSIQRILRNCQSIGFNPIYITGGPLVTPSLLTDPRAEGFLVSSATELYTTTTNPAVAEYLAALSKYASGVKPSISGMAGWTAAKLFEVGLTNATAPTREGLLASMYTIKGNDLGGLTYPLTFTAGKPPPRVSCVWIGQNKGGKLVNADGAPKGRFCE